MTILDYAKKEGEKILMIKLLFFHIWKKKQHEMMKAISAFI